MSFYFDPNDSFGGFATATPPDGCTQCGICLASCPTYLKSEDPDQSPMGRIRLMRALEGDGDDVTAEQLDKLAGCLGCYSCESVCPSRIDFGNMLDASLARIRERRPLPRVTRLMLWMASRPAMLRTAARAVCLSQAFGLRMLASRLGLLKRMGLARADALLGRVRYLGGLTNRVRQTDSERRVALFSGCFTSVMEQDVQQAAIDVFNGLGVEVVVPKGQGCCGALHRHNGELETAAGLARQNVQAFSAAQADAIVSTSSGCGASLKDYGEWLEGEELPMPAMDVTRYLVDLLDQRKPAFAPMPLRVAVHTPCTLRQGEGQVEAVSELLGMIPGVEILPVTGEPRCCGAGGSQVLSQPAMADALRDDLVEQIRAMDADLLVSANLGCAMHLRAGLAQAGIALPLRHPVQLVAQALAV